MAQQIDTREQPVLNLKALSEAPELQILKALSVNDGYVLVNGTKTKAGYADAADTANTAAVASHAYTSDLANVAKIARAVQSADFSSGIFGSGYRLAFDENGKGVLEVDDLNVRGTITASELAIQRIKSIGGSFVVSSSAKAFTVTQDGSNYTVGIDTEGGTIAPELEIDDIVICRNFNGANQKYYLARVTAVTTDSFTLAIVEGPGIPAPGDEIVQIDSYTNANRKGIVYMSNSDSGAPLIDVHYGFITNPLTSLKVRLGRLDGITDAMLGTLTGYGLYSENVYLKGTLIATGGNVITDVQFDNELALIDSQFDEIGNDNIATPSEKRMIVKPNYDIAANEIEGLKAQAAALGVDSTAYNNSFYSELQPYVLPIIANLSTASPEDGAPYVGQTLRDKFNAYTIQESLLRKAITLKQKELAQSANNKIDNLQVGVRNILLNSNVPLVKNEGDAAYRFGAYTIATGALIIGKKYTLVVNGTNIGEGRIGAWLSGQQAINDYLIDEETDVTKVVTFIVQGSAGSRTDVDFYHRPSATATGYSKINWATLYEGEVTPPLTYVKAHEDVDAKIDDANNKIDDANNKIDNLQVGGVNLLDDSAAERTSSNEYLSFYNIYSIAKDRIGKKISIAFDIKATKEGLGSLYILGKYSIGYPTVRATTEYKRFSVTVTIENNENAGNYSPLSLYFRYGSGVIPTVRNIRIDDGDVAMSWALSPNDSAKQLLNSVNIGARNYYRNSIAAISLDTGRTSNFLKTDTGFSFDFTNGFWLRFSPFSFPIGDYALSFEIKSTVYINVQTGRENGYNPVTAVPANTWTKVIRIEKSLTEWPGGFFDIYTDGGGTSGSIEIRYIQFEHSNLVTDFKYAIEEVEAKISQLSTAAENAAKVYADAKAVAAQNAAQAHADGKITIEEQARITADANYLQAAKDYAEAQDALLKTATDAYADGVATDAENAAIAAAQAKANLAEEQAKAYADGIVNAEEAARIAEVQEKYLAAKAIADAAQATANTKAGVYYSINNVPDGYKKGELLYQTGTTTIDGKPFTDGQIYIAIRDWASGGPKSANFVLLSTKDGQDALSGISDTNNPNKLTPAKKQQVQIEYNEVQQEFTPLQSQANNLGLDYSQYSLYYNTYVQYITNNGLLNNLTVTTDYNGATYRNNLNNYRYNRDWLRASIAFKLKSTIADLNGVVVGVDGRVTDLNGDVVDLNSTVGGLQGNVTDLNNTVGGLQGNVTDLGNMVGGLQGNVTDLTNTVNGLGASVSNILTDSRKERSGANSSTSDNYLSWQPAVSLKPSTRYVISFFYKTTDNCVGVDCWYINNTNSSRNKAFALNTVRTNGEYKYITGTILTTADTEQNGYLRWTNKGTTNTAAATLYIKAVMFIEGIKPGDWKPHSSETFNFFTGIPANYVAGDKWLPVANYTYNNVPFKAGKEYISNAASSAMNGEHWQATGNDSTYLTEVFKEQVIAGNGVVLAGVIGATENGVVKSYINGITSKPEAFAAGVTNFGLPTETKTIALNHDGSGILAGGKISWQTDGSGAIAGFSITANALSSNDGVSNNNISIKTNGDFKVQKYQSVPANSFVETSVIEAKTDSTNGTLFSVEKNTIIGSSTAKHPAMTISHIQEIGISGGYSGIALKIRGKLILQSLDGTPSVDREVGIRVSGGVSYLVLL